MHEDIVKLRKELKSKSIQVEGLRSLVFALKKRLRKLEEEVKEARKGKVTSATRSSQPASASGTKRPLPVGRVPHPEAKTKKLASNELPRPSRAPSHDSYHWHDLPARALVSLEPVYS